MSQDTRPENWHESWVAYAEYDGWAAILHPAGFGDVLTPGKFNFCLVPAATPPSGDHSTTPLRLANVTYPSLEVALERFPEISRYYLDKATGLIEERLDIWRRWADLYIPVHGWEVQDGP